MIKRNRELDLLKGIGIFLMVFDHVGWGEAVHTYIQSFHMPLFFIVSGYLWKKRSWKDVSKARFKSLLIPYFVFATIFTIVRYFLPDSDFLSMVKAVLIYPTDISNIPIAPALWFLPCMYLSSVIYAVLDNYFGNRKWIIVCLITVAGMAYSTLSDAMLPFCLEPVAVALLFMLLGEGINIRKEQIALLLKKNAFWILLIAVEAILAFVNGSVDMRSARYRNPALYILNSMIGTMGYWGLCKFINSLKEPKMLVGGGTALPLRA